MADQRLVDESLDEDDEVAVAGWLGAGRWGWTAGRERLPDAVRAKDDAKGGTDGTAGNEAEDGSRSGC